MEELEAKTFLRQLEKLESVIQNKLIEAERWRSLALTITSNMDGERVQSGGSQQKMADRINKYLDYEKKIDEAVDIFIDKKREVVQMIEKIDNPFYYDLLHRKYIQYKTLEQIAEEMDKSYDAIRKAHGRALEEVRRIIRKKEEA